MKHFVPKQIMEEPKICVYWILIRFSLIRLTLYLFPEELIFLLAKLLLLPYPDLFFIRIRPTEALSTQFTISLILRFSFSLPCTIYLIRCFLIPGCYEKERKTSKLLFYFSGVCFFSLFPATFVRVVPYIWHFLHDLSTTSTNSLTIKFYSKISDYILSTVRALFIPLLRPQIPVMVICLLESKAILLRTCLNNCRILRIRSLVMAALFTPPDIWC
ncbi:hypothetical protein KP509_23G013700 [Ceratopteris richardii]|uniref:Uncharacterized protein n=1 Tax=Ceratopteris richardii TaxID=49495 RepID=A0A8T2RX17_CERRI|nr:hypothetical protein KP509_23G013700 [Ceratopteris richardii]